MTSDAIRLRGITKRFGDTVACDAIDLDLRAGEIHGLLGENGAGKSTLMHIASGLHRPDAGTIEIAGVPVAFASPGDAIRHGIGMVHQHFLLVPVLTVAENITLAREPANLGLLDRRAAHRQVRELSREFGLDVDPGAIVGGLSVGIRQRVEILKALYTGARVLILDEPTAVLTPQETTELFTALRRFAAAGRSIAFISHKLNEVLDVADRITVLRRGRRVEVVDRPNATGPGLARSMVGHDIEALPSIARGERRDRLLEIADLVVSDEDGLDRVKGVSLDISGGEILGVAGVDGNGQRELVEAIAGLRSVRDGAIRLHGRDLAKLDARSRVRAGLGFVPEDRQRTGLAMTLDVAENIGLRTFDRPPAGRYGLLSPGALLQDAAMLIEQFDIRGGGPTTPVRSLSGGNQQKVVLARELSSQPSVLIAMQPTRGLDIGAIEAVHRKLLECRDRGQAVLLVSYELDEILALSDRILVLYEGVIEAEFPRRTPRNVIGLAMAGATASGKPR